LLPTQFSITAIDFVRSRALYWSRLTPGLSGVVANSLNNPENFPEYVSFRQGIYYWVVAGDVLLAFLFAAMILGLLANQAHICFLIVFGVILPLLIELWNLLAILVFKSDFYFSQ
jgi:hypothetical protein